ncbi:MAG: tRNA pseudouridine(55) synthase TruB [Treponemataceae bacterium]|nr:tRNA pseudouridine(55) synthase TruB [Treponemataceae bacterium]
MRPMNKADSCGKNISSLVLLAKQPGRTSFSSLFSVKHALGTKKVGHTGTLDSFAEGLLVVCTGGLTRIASRITAFDKEYEAIIAFGSETDTLDPYGAVVRSAPLLTVDAFKDAFNAFKGELMQKPPAFSALHVDGQRASDLARKGIEIEVPERKITVFSSSIKEIQEKDGLVEYAHVVFHVSKGTYVRSLARDIAASCGSAAHLIGLRRTKVGSFRLEDAAGYELLEPFSIKTVQNGENIKNAQITKNQQNQQKLPKEQIVKNTQNDQFVQSEILKKLRSMTPEVAVECGFTPVFLKDGYVDWFFHGKPLSEKIFNNFPADGNEYAVFTGNAEECKDSKNCKFVGMVERNGRALKYGFVMSNS